MTNQQQLVSASADAIQIFTKQNLKAVVSGGHVPILQGDTFVIDCDTNKIRIAVATLDQFPQSFSIGVQAKQTGAPLVPAQMLPISVLTASTLLKYMDAHFYK
ncbi:hypothetical protein [Pseudomonas sp. 2822-17]|uniref:hypothetical protein n=1 Tax=Pseudomonas sp. 2822-17 TaxID=1712678 RepID=UPI000C14F29A|nr:hypothetical protein [Pseudomonas sp. 2822-17]PIB49803.1 hypothetical protein AOA60_27505 [Pseudomonas sp. 2822-17]